MSIAAAEIFCDSILERDLLPREALLAEQRQWLQCGEVLQNPLPLDTTSIPGSRFLTLQLLHSQGSDAATFYQNALKCICADAQDVRILCATAASGLGKTHLA
jgi:hypothetical protein